MKIWDPLYDIEEADKVIVGFGKQADTVRKCFNKTFTYCPLHKKDLFDMKIIDLGNLSFSEFADEFKKNKDAQYVFLGGDHSITPKITEIIKPKTLLSLDAHLDLLGAYVDANDKDSVVYENPHAQPMRHVAEQGTNVYIRGYRAAALEEEHYAQKKDIDIAFDLQFDKQVDYLSIDLDVLDPIYVETETPEAFGFTPKEVCDVIKKTKPQFADIVEWKPDFGYAQVVAIFKELLFI